MNENKTQPTDVSVDDFLASVQDPRRQADARRLRAMMEGITGEAATMWGPSIIGFGSRHYRYDSGREGDMPAISFSPRKTSLVLYINGATEEHSSILGRLGTHTTGKACIYVKLLTDIDETVLVELIRASLLSD